MSPAFRNLLVRTASGIVFLCILLTALLTGKTAFCLIFSFIVAVMTTEYLNVSIGKKHKAGRAVTTVICTGGFILTFLYCGGIVGGEWFVLLPAACCLLPVCLLYEKDKASYGSFIYLFIPILYIALPFSMTNFIIFDNGTFDAGILLSIMIIIWSSDVGAYLCGMAFGQKNGHRLFPSISPKKSWEGYIGGLVFAIIAGYFVCGSLVLALIINIASTFGDLAESQFKRNFEVKDAGKIMPGHGGLLDRFDGALIAFPVSAAYILLVGI